MWVAFSQNGQSIERQLNYEILARQGVTNSFNIFVYFNGISDMGPDYLATITFERPDGTLVETTYFMDYVDTNENIFDPNLIIDNPSGITSPFISGLGYKGFKFTPEDPAILSMAGTYKATVNLYKGSSFHLVCGLISFTVGNAAFHSSYEISATQYEEIIGKLSLIDDINANYVTTNTAQTISGLKNFINGVQLNDWKVALSSEKMILSYQNANKWSITSDSIYPLINGSYFGSNNHPLMRIYTIQLSNGRSDPINTVNIENKANKVVILNENSTHNKYPSAKAVVDYVEDNAVSSSRFIDTISSIDNDLGGIAAFIYLYLERTATGHITITSKNYASNQLGYWFQVPSSGDYNGHLVYNGDDSVVPSVDGNGHVYLNIN